VGRTGGLRTVGLAALCLPVASSVAPFPRVVSSAARAVRPGSSAVPVSRGDPVVRVGPGRTPVALRTLVRGRPVRLGPVARERMARLGPVARERMARLGPAVRERTVRLGPVARERLVSHSTAGRDGMRVCRAGTRASPAGMSRGRPVASAGPWRRAPSRPVRTRASRAVVRLRNRFPGRVGRLARLRDRRLPPGRPTAPLVRCPPMPSRPMPMIAVRPARGVPRRHRSTCGPRLRTGTRRRRRGRRRSLPG
jgi:hypothetical protein